MAACRISSHLATNWQVTILYALLHLRFKFLFYFIAMPGVLAFRQATFGEHGIQGFIESLDCLVNVLFGVRCGQDEEVAP